MGITRSASLIKAKLLPWCFQGKPFETAPSDAFGFAYLIEIYDTGTITQPEQYYTDILNNTVTPRFAYVGQKRFVRKRTTKLSKRELDKLEVKAGRKPKKKVTTGESDWKTYIGSSKELHELAKHERYTIKRTILQFASSIKHLNYLELKFQIQHNVLENQEYYLNRQILNRYFSKDVVPAAFCKVCEYKYR